jgi:hypothetical protein
MSENHNISAQITEGRLKHQTTPGSDRKVVFLDSLPPDVWRAIFRFQLEDYRAQDAFVKCLAVSKRWKVQDSARLLTLFSNFLEQNIALSVLYENIRPRTPNQLHDLAVLLVNDPNTDFSYSVRSIDTSALYIPYDHSDEARQAYWNSLHILLCASSTLESANIEGPIQSSTLFILSRNFRRTLRSLTLYFDDVEAIRSLYHLEALIDLNLTWSDVSPVLARKPDWSLTLPNVSSFHIQVCPTDISDAMIEFVASFRFRDSCSVRIHFMSITREQPTLLEPFFLRNVPKSVHMVGRTGFLPSIFECADEARFIYHVPPAAMFTLPRLPSDIYFAVSCDDEDREALWKALDALVTSPLICPTRIHISVIGHWFKWRTTGPATDEEAHFTLEVLQYALALFPRGVIIMDEDEFDLSEVFRSGPQ